MTELTVAPARGQQDAEAAQKLALSIFAPASDLPAYAEYKAALWFEDPAYVPENVIVARSGGEICGVTRIVPRTMFRADEAYEMAGISSVCVSPVMQGRGVSRELLAHTLERCRERGFDFAFLVARRAADHYYTRFGFWGIASYSRVSIRLPDSTPSGTVLLGEPDTHDIPFYRAVHEACYAGTFGRIARTDAGWRFMLQRCRYLGLRVASFSSNSRKVGYAIFGETAVHELAYTCDAPVGALLHALGHVLSVTAPVKLLTLTLALPPEHRLFADAYGLDMTLSLRECTYGGHMARVLNAGKLLLRVRKRAAEAAAALDHLCDAKSLSHRDTCRILGAWSPTDTSPLENTPLHFNVSLLDEL